MGHVFISYSHKDTRYAHGLADHFRNMGFDTWIDERLDYGSQWPHEIQRQLDSCDAFILIMTPRSFASEWVQSELQRAKRKRKPIFPVLLEGEEPWLSVESTQFYDVRDGKLPGDEFYADLRQAMAKPGTPPVLLRGKTSPEKPRKRNARLFAVLGVFGALSVCLIFAIPMLRRETGNRPLLGVAAETKVSTPPVTPPASTSLPIQIPDGEEVTLFSPSGNTFRYTILSGERQALSADTQLLRLRVRIWSDYGAGVNFGSGSFRLTAGDKSLAPVNFFGEVVEGNETMEKEVEFEIDSSLREAVLVITVGMYPEDWATKELLLVLP